MQQQKGITLTCQQRLPAGLLWHRISVARIFFFLLRSILNLTTTKHKTWISQDSAEKTWTPTLSRHPFKGILYIGKDVIIFHYDIPLVCYTTSWNLLAKSALKSSWSVDLITLLKRTPLFHPHFFGYILLLTLLKSFVHNRIIMHHESWFHFLRIRSCRC